MAIAFDRAASPLRWLVLVLACLSMFGSYYVYDNPAALASEMKDELSLSNTQFALFYSVYSFPNIILPLFGGALVDKFGTNMTLFTFLCLITAGQAVFAFAVSVKKYWLMLVGRTIFGFGGESLAVANSTLLALWFRGKEMALAMGINLSFSRIGSVVNDQVSPAMYSATSLAGALWLGFFMCCMSLAATCVLIMVERWAARRASETAAKQKLLDIDYDEEAMMNSPSWKDHEAAVMREKLERSKKKKLSSRAHGSKSNGTSDALMASPADSLSTPASNKFDPPALEPMKDKASGEADEPEPEHEPNMVKLSDIRAFPTSFWLITASCVVVYAAVLPFNNIAGDLLKEEYGYGKDKRNRYLAIPFFISACVSPFLGAVVDRFGNRARLLTASSFTLMTAHAIFAFSDVEPALPLTIIGCSYSVYAAAIWPSVAFVVEERFLGTAYGLITAVQNAGLGFVPVIVGVIRDKTGHYKYVSIFFASIALVGILIGVALNIIDARDGGVLNRASIKKTPSAESSEKTRLLDDDYLASQS